MDWLIYGGKTGFIEVKCSLYSIETKLKACVLSSKIKVKIKQGKYLILLFNNITFC